MTDLPAAVTFGKVVGRFLLAVGDSADPGSEPDAQPAVGHIKLTPQQPNQRVPLPEPVLVTSRPALCSLDSEGYLVDEQGARGVWLVTGYYDVSFSLKGVRLNPVTIHVTVDHTGSAPLDLVVAVPPPGAALGGDQYSELSGRIQELVAAGGVSDHGALTGLTDDDHTQYHTNARGDVRYYLKSEVDALVAGSTGDAEFIRDTVAAFVVQGSNMLVSHNDVADTLTLDAVIGVHSHTSTQISDSTSVGRAVLTAASQSEGRDAIGAGVGNVVGTGVTAIVAIGQAAYDALTPKVATTLYIINGA